MKTRVNPNTGKLEAYTPSTPGYQRSYGSAKHDRLTAGWASANNIDADRVIAQDIATMRNRSRHAEQDESYFQRFLMEMETNIIGKDGIAFVSKARQKRGGGLNQSACTKISQAWKDFSMRGNFDVTRQFSRAEFERLAIRSVARDGQFLPRLVSGISKLPFSFGVQGFEADALDHTYTDPENNIRCGIQRDEWDEPTSYNLLKRDPRSYGYARNGQEYTSVPAADMLHLFVSERINQSVGVPWGNAALMRLHFLTKYEEAALVNARLQANNHVYFESDAESEGYDGSKNDDGTIDAPSEPGQSTALPRGVKAHAPMPSQPDPNYPSFRKGILQGASAGLMINYPQLAADLEGVSFSSIRSGTLADRAIWSVIQCWFINEFEIPLFQRWLPMAILSGELDLPIADLPYLAECEFNGRRWDWVDPMRDINAAAAEVELGINSRQNISRERGRNFDATTEENAADTEAMKDAGLLMEPSAQTEQEAE